MAIFALDKKHTNDWLTKRPTDQLTELPND